MQVLKKQLREQRARGYQAASELSHGPQPAEVYPNEDEGESSSAPLSSKSDDLRSSSNTRDSLSASYPPPQHGKIFSVLSDAQPSDATESAPKSLSITQSPSSTTAILEVAANPAQLPPEQALIGLPQTLLEVVTSASTSSSSSQENSTEDLTKEEEGDTSIESLKQFVS